MFSETFNGITIHRFGVLAGQPGLLHGVSDRHGGASGGEYASLNLGLHVGDRPERVLQNRRMLCRAAGIDPLRLAIGEQVHGGKVCVVSADDAGRGAVEHAAALAGADGLVCAQPGLPLMAFSADCPLVIMFDSQARVLGLVHASWRSTAAGIVQAAAEAMSALGACPERLCAAIAPCVGKCCYEVGDDLIDSVLHSRIPDADSYIGKRDGRTFFDVEGAVAGCLRAAGVARGQIEIAGACTACSCGRFYSYRSARGKTGRFAAFAQIATPRRL